MKRSQILASIFFLVVWITLLFFGTKGVVYTDEGYILSSAQRVMQGQIPYKDFPFVYTPFTIYVTAASFLILGKSILAGRILMILIALGTSFILYRLLQNLTKNKVLLYLAIGIYISWGPLHIPFPWPVIFSVSLSILFFYLIVVGSLKKNLYYVLGAGVITFLAFLTKQNFGFAFLGGFSVFFVSNQLFHKKKALLYALLGFLGASSCYVFYLLSTNSFIPFWEDFYFYTLKRIVIEQSLSTAFVIGESVVYKVLKMIFYLSPLILSGIVGIFAYRTKATLLFIPVFIALFYALGIRPTTDYIHLSPLLTFMGILFVMQYELTRHLWVRRGIVCMMVLFCFMGVYSAYFMGFYKWEPPFSKATQALSIPKSYVYLDSFQKDEIVRLKAVVDKKIEKSENIYIYAYLPLLYFLLDHENPTRYDLIEQTNFYTTTEKIIINQLQKKHIRLIITIKTPGKTPLGDYIQKEYTNTEKVNGLFIWEKK